MESAIYEEFIPDANYTIKNARYSCSNNLSIIFKDATFQPPEMVIFLNGFNLPLVSVKILTFDISNNYKIIVIFE